MDEHRRSDSRRRGNHGVTACSARALLAALVVGAGAAAPSPASGQEVGLTLGAGTTQVRERALNDLVHQGLSPSPLELRLDIGGSRLRHTFELAVGFALLASRYEAEASSLLLGVDLGWRPAWLIRQPVRRLSLAVGPALSASTRLMVFSSWDDSHGYYLTAYSLGAAASLRFRATRRVLLFLEVSTPLVAVVARPESPITRKADDPGGLLGRLHDNARLTSLHGYRGVDLDVGITVPGAPWYVPALVYQLTYHHAGGSGERPLQILSHAVALRVQLGRGRSREVTR